MGSILEPVCWSVSKPVYLLVFIPPPPVVGAILESPCLSVRLCVCLSVGSSVRPSVCQSSDIGIMNFPSILLNYCPSVKWHRDDELSFNTIKLFSEILDEILKRSSFNIVQKIHYMKNFGCTGNQMKHLDVLEYWNNWLEYDEMFHRCSWQSLLLNVLQIPISYHGNQMKQLFFA